MHNLVELPGEQLIDVRDPGVDRRLDIFGDADRPLHDLFDESSDLFARLVALLLIPADAPFVDDPFEQALFLLQHCGRFSLYLFHLVTHEDSSFAPSPPGASSPASLPSCCSNSVLLMISCKRSLRRSLPSVLASNAASCLRVSI